MDRVARWGPVTTTSAALEPWATPSRGQELGETELPTVRPALSSRLMGSRTVSRALQDCQVELANAVGAGEHLDVDDLPVRDREGKCDARITTPG
jgi:hypothetical protein